MDVKKQVRVDNWGAFFMQRLQTFFSKTDHCDMTLQFEGKLQLKVHRLVMNACTDYFQYLEETCARETESGDVIMMPDDLQADVIVPIVNFMYTGTLEFNVQIFDKLYQTSQIMSIGILNKLLNAQKQNINKTKAVRRASHQPITNLNKTISLKRKPEASAPSTQPQQLMPPALTRRPTHAQRRPPSMVPFQSSNMSPAVINTKPNYRTPPDPLCLADAQPKPTRFEWPEEGLPATVTIGRMIDTSFEEPISYNSKPLLTREDEARGNNVIFDELRNNTPTNHQSILKKPRLPPQTQQHNASLALDDDEEDDDEGLGGAGGGGGGVEMIDMDVITEYVQEQKIRSTLAVAAGSEGEDEEYEQQDGGGSCVSGAKRKAAHIEENSGGIDWTTKKVRFEETPSGESVVSVVTTDSVGGEGDELNHSKLINELLKKYPELAKRNQNIKVKIVTKASPAVEKRKKGRGLLSQTQNKPRSSQNQQHHKLATNNTSATNTATRFIRSMSPSTNTAPTTNANYFTSTNHHNTATTTTAVATGPNNNQKVNKSKKTWTCKLCSLEFNLFYLYRRHNVEVHNQMGDEECVPGTRNSMCKYCGQRFSKYTRLVYHLYTMHSIKPQPPYTLVNCAHCPYMAAPEEIDAHQTRHTYGEERCAECTLTFSCRLALTGHIKITGHTSGKKGGHGTGKPSFDCQYCTKKYQSGANLFSHVGHMHQNEAIRDGIVSIKELDESEMEEEDDDVDDDDENQEIETKVEEEEEEEELGAEEEEEGEDESKTEYILPEIMEESVTKKVNILSDVKVPTVSGNIESNAQSPQQQQQQIRLVPSSEAEALNNVASGIATSLGLVDIVVLQDNTQILLKRNNEYEVEEGEFILPISGGGGGDIDSENRFVQQHHTPQNGGGGHSANDDNHHQMSEGDVEIVVSTNAGTTISNTITTTTVTRSDLLSDHDNTQTELMTEDGVSVGGENVASGNDENGGDMGSTDELVMVLTDHDYGDNNEEISADDTNIVVLYSHPVVGEGQQQEYISREGNLTLNSETGVLEIRKHPEQEKEDNEEVVMDTSSNSIVVNTNKDQSESIELIQREIEGENCAKSLNTGLDECAQQNADNIEKNENLELVNEEQFLIQNETISQDLTGNNEPMETENSTINEPSETETQYPDAAPKITENVQNVDENLEGLPRDIDGSSTKAQNEDIIADEYFDENEEPSPPHDNLKDESDESAACNVKSAVQSLDNDNQCSDGIEFKNETEEPQLVSEEQHILVTPENEDQIQGNDNSRHSIKDEQEDNKEGRVKKVDEDIPEIVGDSDVEKSIAEIFEDKIEETSASGSAQAGKSEEIKESVEEVFEGQKDATTKQQTNIGASTAVVSSVKSVILNDWDDTDSQHSDLKETNKETNLIMEKLIDDWVEEDENV